MGIQDKFIEKVNEIKDYRPSLKGSLQFVAILGAAGVGMFIEDQFRHVEDDIPTEQQAPVTTTTIPSPETLTDSGLID